MSLDIIRTSREVRRDLTTQIQKLSARARSDADDRAYEELGLPRDSDRVLDLRRRLAEVESLLKIVDDPGIQIDAARFAIEEVDPATLTAGAKAGATTRPSEKEPLFSGG